MNDCNWYVMTFVKSKFCQRPPQTFHLIVWRHPERASEYQFPALATLIYVDWLPTGQWSAVSSIVYSRGSQISLCQHSYFVDSSNLEMAEALSGCLQLLLLLLARCVWRKPSYICLITHPNSGMMMSRLRSTASGGPTLILAARCYTCIRQRDQSSCPT